MNDYRDDAINVLLLYVIKHNIEMTSSKYFTSIHTEITS